MITISLNNRSNVLQQLAVEWIKNSATKTTYSTYDGYQFYDDDDEDDYVKQLWMNAFGITSGHNLMDDDDDYWDDYGYGPKHIRTFSDDDDDDDDSEEYHRFLEDTEVISSGIWDDDDEWGRVSELYDSYDKSTGAINSIMHSATYNSHAIPKHRKSKLFQDVEKQQKEAENNWRQEVLNDITDSDTRTILYYDDPKHEITQRTFTEIDDFLMFCEDNNIEVDDACKSDIEFYTQSHCGLDEYALSNGRKELRCARSYGELMYDLYGSDLFYDESLDYAKSQSSNTDDLPF